MKYTGGPPFDPIERQKEITLPKLFIKYILQKRACKKKSSFSASYSKRIGRLNYMSLNPGIHYMSEYSSVLCNPELNPEYIIHALKLGYDYGKMISAALSYTYTKSKINEIIITSQGENTIYQARNLKKRRDL